MPSSNFSSLENIEALINGIINVNEKASPLKYIKKLVNDLTKSVNLIFMI